ncbi:MAG: LysE family translocator [Deltaproteobacteria bacterium]|nr:LysE family translocator [Deltaproteobacteria bacterium]
MSWNLWLAFAAASSVLLVIPGPTILLVVGYALGAGRGPAGWIALGVVCGDLAAMSASLAGMGLLMSASAEMFTAVKWLGAAYLIWLGARMWLKSGRHLPEGNPGLAAGAVREIPVRRMALNVFTVTALNPKGITFFVAFLPQFLAPGQPVWPQLLILGSTFLVLAFLNALSYALLAGQARGLLGRPVWRRGVERSGAALLMSAGVWAALKR